MLYFLPFIFSWNFSADSLTMNIAHLLSSSWLWAKACATLSSLKDLAVSGDCPPPLLLSPMWISSLDISEVNGANCSCRQTKIRLLRTHQTRGIWGDLNMHAFSKLVSGCGVACSLWKPTNLPYYIKVTWVFNSTHDNNFFAVTIMEYLRRTLVVSNKPD